MNKKLGMSHGMVVDTLRGMLDEMHVGYRETAVCGDEVLFEGVCRPSMGFFQAYPFAIRTTDDGVVSRFRLPVRASGPSIAAVEELLSRLDYLGMPGRFVITPRSGEIAFAQTLPRGRFMADPQNAFFQPLALLTCMGAFLAAVAVGAMGPHEACRGILGMESAAKVLLSEPGVA